MPKKLVLSVGNVHTSSRMVLIRVVHGQIWLEKPSSIKSYVVGWKAGSGL
jgi:hypothetical protein